MNVIIDLCKVNRRALIIVSIAIVLDIVTGIIKACLEQDLMSSEFRKGLMKKVLDYVLIIVAFSLDVLLEVDYIGNAVTISLIGMEFYSVLENIKDYVPIPDILKKVMGQLKEDETE